MSLGDEVKNPTMAPRTAPATKPRPARMQLVGMSSNSCTRPGSMPLVRAYALAIIDWSLFLGDRSGDCDSSALRQGEGALKAPSLEDRSGRLTPLADSDQSVVAADQPAVDLGPVAELEAAVHLRRHVRRNRAGQASDGDRDLRER